LVELLLLLRCIRLLPHLLRTLLLRKAKLGGLLLLL
jgi:hypothetical protein